MPTRPSDEDARPAEPDIDANGVDRAQIRAMLALTPGFVEAAFEIRELNAPRPLR